MKRLFVRFWNLVVAPLDELPKGCFCYYSLGFFDLPNPECPIHGEDDRENVLRAIADYPESGWR